MFLCFKTGLVPALLWSVYGNVGDQIQAASTTAKKGFFFLNMFNSFAFGHFSVTG